MDAPDGTKSDPLWPIIAFKRYVLWLRDTMASSRQSTPEPEVPSSITASQGEKQALFKLYKYTSQSCDMPLDVLVSAIPEPVAAELWRRLVEAHVFAEVEVNDALRATLRGPIKKHSLFDPVEEARFAFETNRYEMLQALLLWLDVDKRLVDASQCVEKHRRLLLKPTEEVFDVFVPVVVELKRYQQLLENLDDAEHLFRCASPDDGIGLGACSLREIREELAQLLATCIRRVCERPLNNGKDQTVVVADDDLRTVLRLLFAYATELLPGQSGNCYALLSRITPDNSEILANFAQHVYQAVRETEGRELLQYLLDHQRPVLNSMCGLARECRNLSVLLVTDMCLKRCSADRSMLSFLKRNKLRFDVDLPTRCYANFADDVVDRMASFTAGEMTLDIVYWMVQFGYPLHTTLAREVHTDGEPVVAYTLLERCILGLACAELKRNRWAATALKREGDGTEVRRYFGSVERTKCAALRFLITEGFPVPRPKVLGCLLENFALTTLFTVVCYLFRAGKRVTFPASTSMRNRPSLFPETALLTRQMIVRFEDTCPKNFLNRLESVGGCVRSKMEMTLTGLAMNVVHRNLRSDRRYPRLRPDNYKQLQRQPVRGEVTLPLCITLVPPAMIAQLNLDDVMESFRATIREVGVKQFAFVKDDFAALAGCY